MNTIHLQGIGKSSAKPAQELQPGEVVIWNYGWKSTVISIREVSPSYLMVTLRSHYDQKEYQRRMKKIRLVGIEA